MRVLLFTAVLSLNSFAATLSGNAKFAGTAPKPELLRMNADAACAQAHPTPVTKQDLLVSAKGGLANVFVTVTGPLPKTIPPAPTAPAVLDQKGCLYSPRVLGLRVNQKLQVMNSDTTLHNVNAVAKENRAFNVGMVSKAPAIEKSFAKAERMIRFKCDVHGWMTAWIAVMEHPWFGVTDAEGNFSIADLPPGEYTLEAWHEKLGTQTARVSVAANGSKAPVSFAFSSKAAQ